MFQSAWGKFNLISILPQKRRQIHFTMDTQHTQHTHNNTQHKEVDDHTTHPRTPHHL